MDNKAKAEGSGSETKKQQGSFIQEIERTSARISNLLQRKLDGKFHPDESPESQLVNSLDTMHCDLLYSLRRTVRDSHDGTRVWAYLRNVSAGQYMDIHDVSTFHFYDPNGLLHRWYVGEVILPLFRQMNFFYTRGYDIGNVDLRAIDWMCASEEQVREVQETVCSLFVKSAPIGFDARTHFFTASREAELNEISRKEPYSYIHESPTVKLLFSQLLVDADRTNRQFAYAILMHGGYSLPEELRTIDRLVELLDFKQRAWLSRSLYAERMAIYEPLHVAIQQGLHNLDLRKPEAVPAMVQLLYALIQNNSGNIPQLAFFADMLNPNSFRFTDYVDRIPELMELIEKNLGFEPPPLLLWNLHFPLELIAFTTNLYTGSYSVDAAFTEGEQIALSHNYAEAMRIMAADTQGIPLTPAEKSWASEVIVFVTFWLSLQEKYVHDTDTYYRYHGYL